MDVHQHSDDIVFEHVRAYVNTFEVVKNEARARLVLEFEWIENWVKKHGE